MWRQVLELFIAVVAVWVTLKLLLCVAAGDKELPGYALNMSFRLKLFSILSGELVFWCGSRCLSSQIDSASFWRIMFLISLGIVAGCLLMACVTDCQNCMVYHFVWWVGGTAAMLLLLLSCGNRCSADLAAPPSYDLLYPASAYPFLIQFAVTVLRKLLPLFLFGLLQEKLFSRMYGKADCHAFVVCAIAGSGAGWGMKEYLMHMLLAIMLLAVVQGAKGNVGRNGNLKRGVAFLPYITISFWVLLVAEVTN